MNTIYIPSGEYTNDRNRYYVNDIDGSPAGTEPGGMNPHDTIFRNGHRYYGGIQDTYLCVLGTNGDSGDVIDTTTHKPATYLDKRANCRHGFIEMDWTKGAITGTATHVGWDSDGVSRSG